MTKQSKMAENEESVSQSLRFNGGWERGEVLGHIVPKLNLNRSIF